MNKLLIQFGIFFIYLDCNSRYCMERLNCECWMSIRYIYCCHFLRMVLSKKVSGPTNPYKDSLEICHTHYHRFIVIIYTLVVTICIDISGAEGDAVGEFELIKRIGYPAIYLILNTPFFHNVFYNKNKLIRERFTHNKKMVP